MKRQEEASEHDPRQSVVPTSQVSSVLARRAIKEEEAELARALDRLLVAVSDLPVERGAEATASALLDALAEACPRESFGIVLAHDGPPGLALVRSGAYPEATAVQPASSGELFPREGAERVIVAGPDARLHVATQSPDDLGDGSLLTHLAIRAAFALERGVAFARKLERARQDADDLRALHGHVVASERLASVGQIAAGVVHELNNPLTSIVAYTDVLLRKTHAPEDAERLRRIGESAGRILRFSRDLVTYARPSEAAPERVRLESVVERALAFCEHEIGAAGASVERHYEPATASFYGLPEPLTQVFVNLLTNACHAVDGRGGVIRVRVTEEPRAVVATVEDDGHGIPPEHLGQIFAPFFTTKTDGRGTGLGLSIVKNIVEKHDATVEVTSGSTGTRFVLRFRKADAPGGT